MRPRPGFTLRRDGDVGFAVREYIEGAGNLGFIGLQVMPLWEAAAQSKSFPVIPLEVLLSSPDTRRAPRGNYNRSTWEYEYGEYSTRENGHEEPIDDVERELYKDDIDADMIAGIRAAGIILRSQERRIAAKVFNTTNFTVHNVTNEWDKAADGTPITDIAAGKEAVVNQCGKEPNTLIITYKTLVKLRQSAQIIDRLKYTYPGIDIESIGAKQLASIFDVPRVLVAGAKYNSAKQGQAGVVSNIWSDEYAMLTVTSDAPDVSEPCIGRTFLWTGDSDSNQVVEEYREEQIRSDVFRVRHNTDERLIQSIDDDGAIVSNIAANCSYLFGNVNTI